MPFSVPPLLGVLVRQVGCLIQMKDIALSFYINLH